jgi:hypothetical protein
MMIEITERRRDTAEEPNRQMRRPSRSRRAQCAGNPLHRTDGTAIVVARNNERKLKDHISR